MKIIKKLILITALLSSPLTQSIEPKHGQNEFEKAAGRTILASLLINTVAACANDNLIPIKAFVPAAIIMGIGMGTLGYLDSKALKKNPTCGANKRNSRILQSIVIAAGLTPIILSDSQSGKMLRETLAPVGELLLDAGSTLLDAATSTLIRGKTF